MSETQYYQLNIDFMEKENIVDKPVNPISDEEFDDWFEKYFEGFLKIVRGQE
jgi:hypothetical protein